MLTSFHDRAVPLSTVLVTLAQAIDEARSLDDIYQAALNGVTAVAHLPRAAILLFDPDGVMRFKASTGLSSDYCAAVEGHTPWRAGQPAAEPVVVPDVTVEESLRQYSETFRRERIHALAFIPIINGGGVIGKFMLYRDVPDAFDRGEVPDALAIGYQIGLAVERARREKETSDAHQRQAEHHAFLQGGVGEVLAVEHDAAARGQQAHQRVERGGLAGAVGADHRDHLAAGQLEVQAGQHFGAAIAGLQVLDLQQGRGHQCSVPR